MSLYVTDTHPLLWYATSQYIKLSKKALRVFKEAERGQALIYIPAMVLWEAGLLDRIKKVQLLKSFDQWGEALLAHPGFDLAPLDFQVIAEALQLSLNRDLFDMAIVATAKVKDLPLITKDKEISDAQIVEVAW